MLSEILKPLHVDNQDLIRIGKIKILDKKTKKKYPIDGLDFKNYHRKPDIELNFNE